MFDYNMCMFDYWGEIEKYWEDVNIYYIRNILGEIEKY